MTSAVGDEAPWGSLTPAWFRLDSTRLGSFSGALISPTFFIHLYSVGKLTPLIFLVNAIFLFFTPALSSQFTIIYYRS